jgi:hypothetical protein
MTLNGENSQLQLQLDDALNEVDSIQKGKVALVEQLEVVHS